jgi:hypothetical protein
MGAVDGYLSRDGRLAAQEKVTWYGRRDDPPGDRGNLWRPLPF